MPIFFALSMSLSCLFLTNISWLYLWKISEQCGKNWGRHHSTRIPYILSNMELERDIPDESSDGGFCGIEGRLLGSWGICCWAETITTLIDRFVFFWNYFLRLSSSRVSLNEIRKTKKIHLITFLVLHFSFRLTLIEERRYKTGLKNSIFLIKT